MMGGMGALNPGQFMPMIIDQANKAVDALGPSRNRVATPGALSGAQGTQIGYAPPDRSKQQSSGGGGGGIGGDAVGSLVESLAGGGGEAAGAAGAAEAAEIIPALLI